ncbi:hypothetical protein KBD49_13260 [Myxococcota bacterium]|jgi:hypothetical protein|nr:hypothetical protein [Myxococcota bacterium]
MARRKENGALTQGNDEPLQDLAVLFERYRVPHWSRAGLVQQQGWAAGKRLAEREFLAALESWRRGPMGR